MQIANQAAAKLKWDPVIQANKSTFLLKKADVKNAIKSFTYLIYNIYISVKVKESKTRKLLGAILALKRVIAMNPETGAVRQMYDSTKIIPGLTTVN